MINEARVERHKNYQGLGATVENPKLYFSGDHLRNSRHPYAADGVKVKTGKVERFADMIDFEGTWVNSSNRSAWENMRARIRILHEDGIIEVDEKGYPINPNEEAHDILGMGELWEWGPIIAASAAITTKTINTETGQEETYLWCVKKEGEEQLRLPGGVINKDEDGNYTEKPFEAASRELTEESGLRHSLNSNNKIFQGVGTGSRQTKHSWFADIVYQDEIENGLGRIIEKGSDQTGYIDLKTGVISEKGEIAEAGWHKITPHFWDNFNPSHKRMLEQGKPNLFQEIKPELDLTDTREIK